MSPVAQTADSLNADR